MNIEQDNPKRLYRLVEIASAMLDKPISQFLHFSFITNKNKILSVGWNDVTSSPIKIYGKHVQYPHGGAHSEIKSIKKIRDFNIFKHCTMVNIRLNNRGEFRNSCPCPICYNLISTLGFKKIYYTTNTDFEMIKL